MMQEWRDGIPRNPMYLMANAWWPTWLTGAAPDPPRSLVIERIRRGV
jgi:hypothetical protein